MSYLPVVSNDTLSHFALPGAPETLCGKIVVDRRPRFEAPNSDSNSNGYAGSDPDMAATLPCDVCATLSGGDSILKQTQAARDCPYCDDGYESNGLACLYCGGAGTLDEDGEDEYATDLDTFDTSDLKGRKVAAADGMVTCENPGCGRRTNITTTVGNEQHCLPCAMRYPSERGERVTDLDPASDNPDDKITPIRRTATNWTRDGVAIEDGFTVTVSADMAARTPFLDHERVAVSESVNCPDCGDDHWMSRIASCIDCDGLKCSGCMETIGIDSFFGTCKKCAGAESDLAYETGFEDRAQPDQDLYLSYLMQETDEDTDPLFLPDTYE